MLTRGDVYAVPARRSAQGHEQRGPRLGVVVQSDDLPLSVVPVEQALRLVLAPD